MSDYGIKFSQPGYDVNTATDKQLTFTSKYAVFQADLVSVFTLTLPGGGGTNTYDVAHGYGYIPVFLAEANGRMLPENASGTTYSLEIKADSTKIRFILTSSFSESVPVRLYIFRNRIE